MQVRRIFIAGLALAALAPVGCARWFARRADREAGALLAAYEARHWPRPVAMEDLADTAGDWSAILRERMPAPPDWARDTGPARVLTLAQAVELAVSLNRDYLLRRETLYLTALTLTGERHRFSLRPGLTWDARSVGGKDVDSTIHQSALGEVSKILLLGGTVRLTGRQGVTHTIERHDDPEVYGASGAVELTQPLLRGFGYTVSHESLIQAQRDLIYDLRDFFQYRQDFAIQVTQAYWNLQGLRERVRNQERSLARLEELKKRADARFDKGAAEALDRFRAAAEVLRGQNDLKDQRRAYEFALDQFKVLLGLPVTAAIDVAEDRPLLVEIDPDLARAVRAALLNRVDLLNAAGRVEDADRAVRVARNALLADLDLTVRHENATVPAERFDNQHWGPGETVIGLTLALPVDRKFERNAYREALIAGDRRRRACTLVEDQVVLDVRERVRELRLARSTVDLQRESVEQLKRELEMANIRVERGEASNRDAVDAEARLLDAENRLVQALVDHAIARLRFRRSIGTLEIDEKGMWRE